MKLVTSTKRPTRDAIRQNGDTWLVVDDTELEAGAVELSAQSARDAAPPRYDLDPTHPLYGKRALRVVPSGSIDIVVNDLGVLELSHIAVELEEVEISP